MLRLFKKKNGPSPIAHGWVMVGVWINTRQRKLADILQAKMQTLSAQKQTGVIMSICLVFTMLSVYLLYEGTKTTSAAILEYPPLQPLKIDTIIK